MRLGDIVCTKSVTHRIPVEVHEPKNGKRQRVLANQIGFKFQSEISLLSQVGVFIFLGVHPESADDGERVHRFAEQQLRRLGWTTESAQSVPAVGEAVDASSD
jgi:Tat protein secretion system quality control protein TatD with DNase activity